MRLFNKYLLIFFFSIFLFPQTQQIFAADYCGPLRDGSPAEEISEQVRYLFKCEGGKIIKQEQFKGGKNWGNEGSPTTLETCQNGCTGASINGQSCVYCRGSEPSGNTNSPSGGQGILTYEINDIDVGQNLNAWFDPAYNKGGGPLRINGNNRTVKITFKGLGSEKTYYLCGTSNQGNCGIGESDTDATGKKFTSNKSGEIKIEVCGGGKTWLKGKSLEKDEKIHEECKKDRDFFHEGHNYRLGVFQDKKAKANVITAEFFVTHSYPLVKLSPSTGAKFNPLSPLQVTLWGRRPGDDERNNYQVIIEGTNNNYKQEHCMVTKNGSGETIGINTQENQEHILAGSGWDVPATRGNPAIQKFGRGDKEASGIGMGAFVLKINERVSDSRPLGIYNNCEGGFSYVYVYFRLDPDPKSTTGINIYKVVYDPNSSDMEEVRKTFPNPPLPCSSGANDAENGNCTAIDTAIGKIYTTPTGFLNNLFSTVLSISGFGAIIIIVYGGYLFMTSRGDKEKVAAARETITSAVLGLLFIIFSIVILETIGVDILRIPGLTK